MSAPNTPEYKAWKHAYDQEYRERYRERRRQLVKEWYQRRKKADPEGFKKYREATMHSWRKRNPERARRLSWNAFLKRKYGVTLEWFEKQSAEQGGACTICGRIPKGRLAIDHDHSTGKVRGLICRSCNRALGLLKDSPEVLKKALAYLEGDK